MPLAVMSTPYAVSRTPIKNQIEMKPLPCMSRLPEDDVQGEEDSEDDGRPEERALIEREIALVRNLGGAVNETDEFGFGFRLAQIADDDRNDDTDDPRPERAVHVFGHVFSIG